MQFNTPTKLHFGPFEANFSERTLLRDGQAISLEERPFRLLEALLEKSGVIQREDLQRRLWPDSDFGEFDPGVGLIVDQLRRALGDSELEPRFVMRAPGGGCAFVYPVQGKEKR